MRKISVRVVLFPVLFMLLAAGCASAPKVSTDAISSEGASEWMNRYCSKGSRELSGDLVLKSNTPEFKGQFPASIRFEKQGPFLLEVTNILGGTLMRLSSDSRSIDLLVPSKPKLTRKGVTHYLGLEVPVLSQLLLGDLPCPTDWKRRELGVRKNQMVMITKEWTWIFERSIDAEGAVPVKVTLIPTDESSDPKAKIELSIESWDRELHFAKKVIVRSPEGELKWIWKNRDSKK